MRSVRAVSLSSLNSDRFFILMSSTFSAHSAVNQSHSRYIASARFSLHQCKCMHARIHALKSTTAFRAALR